ncbi:MAG TPA: InlB B-repeat-containing protein [Erysipelotrichaceae bacterium]|nr:InlB B-repeat-containing protein [Erysipelotrichaceae bacterium]HQA85582.1 InlB B-repeat-containing protein [Erysipelotrichaceae bacterium]
MGSRFKRKIFIIITILMMLCSIPKVLKAAPVVFNVSNRTQFLKAIYDINNGEESDYIISLKANINILTTDIIELTRGNTTILGNGHEIFNIYGFEVYSDDPAVAKTTLTLGQQDGNNILKIKGTYTGTGSPDSMFYVSNGSILNMHQGVEIYDRKIPLVEYEGFIFYIESESIFNMYGGSIKNCLIAKTTNAGCAMIFVNNATFNMSGGEISGNTVQDSPVADNDWAIYSAALISKNSDITITGGKIINNKIILNSTNSSGDGCALFIYRSTVNISDVNISGNEIIGNKVGCEGGGIYAFESTLVIDNSVITNNKVSSEYGSRGGAISTSYTDLTITNSLVAFNTATNGASDIYFLGFNPGSKLYLPVASSMNTKQTNPYMNLITGWYKDNDDNRWSMTNPSVIEFTTLQNDALIGEYNLVAGYKKAELITYNSNGGQGEDYYQNIGANILALDNAIVGFTRNKYEFTGWNTEADGSGISYAAGASLPPTDLGFILYAQWKAKPLTPDTGDRFNQNVFMFLMILSGLGLVALTKKYKKKENN